MDISYFLCSFATAMRSNLLKIVKGLLFTALVACAVVSCENEKPELYFEPVTIRSVKAVYSDTITFNEGEYFTLNVRTTPYDLLNKVKEIQIDTATKEKYSFATVKGKLMLADNIWNIIVRPENGLKSGDVIMPRFIFEDTVLFASPVVVNMILKPIPIYYDLEIASDTVSAYERGNAATVYLRTTPWNILKTDTNAVITLIDTLGANIDDKVTLQGTELMPDSTWAVKIKVKDPYATSTLVALRLALTDTTLRTSAVDLKKVTFSMRSIRTAGAKALDFNSKTNEYSLCQPTTTDFSAQQLFFFFNGDKVTVGDSIYENGKKYTLDISKPVTFSLWMYDLHKEYTIKMTNTGLPVVRIDTKGQTVTRRDTWVPGATMRIEMPDGTVDYEGTLSLKGRGNGTWDFPKKPYALKLDEKAKILGMHKNKRWILLANYKDRTLLRNDVCLWISKQTDLPYTVNGEFVELVWNGKHMGNYYLCEQIRIDNHRINIHDPNLEEPEKGGYFMRIDAFLGYSDPKWADKGTDLGFWSSQYNLPYIFKDPEEDANGNMLSTNSAAYKYMYNYVQKMEAAIYKLKSDKNSSEWKQYLDPYTAVDFALIQEMTMNHDAYNNWPKNGPKSTYLYKDSAGVMCFGPMWDYDYHTFTLYGDFEYGNTTWNSTENQRLYQWEIMKMTNKGGTYYFSELKRNPEFKALLIERWNTLKEVWKEGFEDYVDEVAEKIRVSESYNQQLWGYPSRENGDWQLTFDQAIEALKTAFNKRWTWIDQNIGNL